MAALMRTRSFAMSLLKMRKMSVAQPENSFQSSAGAPSSSQMIGIGYGSHTSATSSQRPVGEQRLDEVADHPAHHRAQAVGRPRGEGGRHEPAQPLVLVALHGEDRSLLATG